MRLQNKTVLITGGSSGIGFEMARQLVARGNRVIVSGRSEAALQEAKSRLPALYVFAADVSDPNSIDALYSHVSEHFPKLDVLVNCAGVMRKIDLQNARALQDLTIEVDINLKGTMWTVARFLPLLQKQERAAIVNVSSGLAFVPMAISPIYSATKAAIHAYTQSLRGQLAGSTIEVIELAPPGTDTPLFHGDFTPQDTGGAKPMPVNTLVTAALKGIEKGNLEIRPGPANILKVLSRLAPNFAFRLVNGKSLPLMAASRRGKTG